MIFIYISIIIIGCNVFYLISELIPLKRRVETIEDYLNVSYDYNKKDNM